MVQLVPLEIDLGAAKFLCKTLCKVKRAGPANIMLGIEDKFLLESRITLGVYVSVFNDQNERHQGLVHESTAIQAKVTHFVRAAAIGFENIGVVCHEYRLGVSRLGRDGL